MAELHWRSRRIVCPHCLHETDDRDCDVTIEDREYWWECGECEKPFTVSVFYRARYTTHKLAHTTPEHGGEDGSD